MQMSRVELNTDVNTVKMVRRIKSGGLLGSNVFLNTNLLKETQMYSKSNTDKPIN